jgi:Flp pilus assembly pilin Flp
MKTLFRRFVREEAGQDLIEYGLLVGIITAATVGGVTAIAPIVTTYYQGLCTAIGCTP